MHLQIASAYLNYRRLCSFTLCALLLQFLIVGISSLDEAADFPWGRFSDDQVRQVPAVNSPTTTTKQLLEASIETGSLSSPSVSRLNDFNGVNHDFTANRGAFGFRKPKKSQKESKPAVAKPSTAMRAKRAKLLNGNIEKYLKL